MSFFRQLFAKPAPSAVSESTTVASIPSAAKADLLSDRYVQGSFDQVANLDDIYHCFRLILGRNPNPEECKGHSSMVGVELDNVVRSYVQSMEFQHRNLLATNAGKIEAQTIEGFQIYADLSDQAVGIHLASGAYEPHVTAVFKHYLQPGMRVLDIGANIGYFAMLAAKLVKENGHVFAIEPNPDNCKLLEASKHLNDHHHLTILQMAAGKETGILALNTSYSNGTTSALQADLNALINARTVPAIKLDDYHALDAGIDFIKIDVEGAEYNALFGAQNLLRRCKPVVVSEFSPTAMPNISGVYGREYLQFLIGFDYQLSVIEFDGNITPCGDDTEKVMQAFEASGVDHIDILATIAN